MPNQLQKHNAFLYATDLEPDDIVSIMLLLTRLSEQAKQAPAPVKIAFLVGEGNSAIKAARMRKILEKYKSIGLLDDINASVIQGYSDFNGAQRNFTADGKEMLTTQELEMAVKAFSDSNQAETNRKTCEAVKAFLADNSNTLVISLKPMRELQDIYHQDNSVFKQHVLACTGSYNFRSICWSKDKNEENRLQGELLKLCNAFAQSFIYETYSTTETNSTSNQNAEAFFNLVEKAAADELLGALRVFIHDWNTYLLADDRRKLPELMKKLSGFLQSELTERFINAFQADYTESNWKLLRPVVEEGVKKCADNKEALDAFQSLGRLIGKWKNLTQAKLQIVNADPGLIAVLTGACDGHISLQPAKLAFQGVYTSLSQPDENTRTMVYLPGKDTSLEKYLEWRKAESASKNKVAALKACQEDLLASINNAITAAGLHIVLTQRVKDEMAQEAKMVKLLVASQSDNFYRNATETNRNTEPVKNTKFSI